MDVSVVKPHVTRAFGQMCSGECFRLNDKYYLVVGESLKANRAVELESGWLVEMNHYDEVEPIQLQAILKN